MLILSLSGYPAISQGEFVIELNPATGGFTKLGGPIPGVTWVIVNNRAIDESNGLFIFKGGDPDPDLLISVNTQTGSLIYNPPLPPTVGEYMFDNTAATLYGLYYDNSIQGLYLVSINPATGNFLLIGSNPLVGITGFMQGLNTFDEIHHRFIQLNDGNHLFSIDAISGSVTCAPFLALSTGDAVLHLCFDNSTNNLYGFIWESLTQKYWLILIDPSNGNIAKIGNGTVYGAGNGSSAIDQQNQKYIYIYSDDYGDYYLNSIDIASGNIIHNPITVDAGDNIHALKFNQATGKLFGLHWDATMTRTLSERFQDQVCVYPVPSSGVISIKSDREISTVEVINTMGKVVFASYVNHDEAKLDLSMLPKGIYSYQIKGKTDIIKIGKLILL